MIFAFNNKTMVLPLFKLDMKKPENAYIGEQIGFLGVDDDCELIINEEPTKFCTTYLSLYLEELKSFMHDNNLIVLPQNQ